MLTAAPRAVHANAQFQAAGGADLTRHVQATTPQFTPNPSLGQAMNNRNWSAREQQAYYEMGQAPLNHQFTNGTPHPTWGGGNGNALTQYQQPQGPPTGLVARNMSQSQIDAYRGNPTQYYNPRVQTVRPTTAYNRVVGRGQPTMYAWPNQYYPGGSNTYVPSWEATGLLIKYTRNPSYFRINKYVKEMKVPKDMGYYLTLNGDDPYRIVTVNDWLWDDSVDAPGGRQNRQGFGYQPYRTVRYCYPFSLGSKSVTQAEWPILAEHAAVMSSLAMTVRTMVLTSIATTSSNWTGTGFTNYGTASGTWSTSSETDLFIQKSLNSALITIEQATGGIVSDEEALQFTMNPTEARGVSVSPEYRNYIKGSPDALAAITDQRNPNRKYGLAPYLYGLGLVVENAVVVSTPKPANVSNPSTTTRSYILSTTYGYISSRPQGIVAAEEQTLDFSTFAMRFLEMMTVESKADSDNRREVGRVVEDYCVNLQSPQTGFLFTNLG